LQAGDKQGQQEYIVMENGFKSLEPVYKQQSTMFDSKLVKHMRFLYHELDALHRVFKTWEDSSMAFSRSSKELEKSKDKAYNNKKDFSKWNITSEAKASYTVDQLCNNKSLAFKELFPKKTEEVEAIRDLYGYFTNKLCEEFSRLLQKNYENLKNDMLFVCKWYYGAKSEVYALSS
jgi:hypothetical protein